MRRATCRCGQLVAECDGDPVRVSVCHCLSCQQRSGSAFAAQARFPNGAVTITGDARAWTAVSDNGAEAVFHFCPTCGATVYYRAGPFPDLVAIPIGAFADPLFPPPEYSVYEARRHRWVTITGDDVAHFA